MKRKKSRCRTVRVRVGSRTISAKVCKTRRRRKR